MASEPDPNTTAIAVDNLTKTYGSTTVLDGLSFTARRGRVTGFLGPNGAGKSTTLRILLGLTPATSGTALVDGRRFRDLVSPAETVGALLATEQFNAMRSGRAHLRILAATARVPDARVDEVLAEVDLTAAAEQKVGGYSLGMRQRLGLAAALLGDPSILVLDEPANGLDPSGIRWLRALLRARAEAGVAVFVSSHLLAEVSAFADDLVVIHQGRLVTQTTTHDLLDGEQRSLEDVFLDLTGTASR